MQPLPFSVHHLRLSGADREERRTPSRSPLPRPSRLPAPRYGRPWGSTAGRGACRTARPEARRLPFPPAKRRVKLCEVKSAVRRRRGGGGGFVRLFVSRPVAFLRSQRGRSLRVTRRAARTAVDPRDRFDRQRLGSGGGGRAPRALMSRRCRHSAGGTGAEPRRQPPAATPA